MTPSSSQQTATLRALLRSPDAIGAGLLALVMAVLYGRTLCPGVYWYDSAEFAAHAVTLGVPHPPGYPLYAMIAHVFTWLPLEPALSVNLMSLVFGIAAALMLGLFGRRLGLGPAAAVFVTLTLATSKTFWANAVVTEVYTPGLVFTLAVFVILEAAHRFGRRSWLPLAGLVAGLGVGMHMSIATLGLGYAWLVVTHDMRSLDGTPLKTGWRARSVELAKVVGAVLAGLLVFLYVPLRTFETWSRREWIIFRKNATGGTFKYKFRHELVIRDRLEVVWTDVLAPNLPIVVLVLAVVGVVVLMRRHPRLGVGLGLGLLGNSLTFFNYRVPDLDVFYLPTIALLVLFAGFGIDGLIQSVAPSLKPHLRPGWVALSWLCLLVPVSAIPRNYAQVDLSGATEAARYGREACAGIEQPSTIVSFSSPDEWRYYSVFLYEQALGRCREVTIVRKPKGLRADFAARKHPYYAFRPVERFKKHGLRPVPEGRLWRLETRRPRKRTRPKP